MNGIIKIGAFSVMIFVVTLIGVLESHAATKITPDSLVYSLYFRQGDNLLLRDYRGNEHTILAIEKILSSDQVSSISSIKIIGNTSPEGTVEHNRLLTRQRANAVKSYILWRWKALSQDKIQIDEQQDYLSAWLKAVKSNVSVPRQERVIEILESNSSIPTKWANIQLMSKESARYMEVHIFPFLRNAVSCVISYKQSDSTSLIVISDSDLEPIKSDIVVDTLAIVSSELDEIKIDSSTKEQLQEITESYDNIEEQHLKIKKPNKPLFALKTNLLFDAVTILNFEIEVPLGKRFSIAAEGMFPWWLWEGKQNCIQVVSGNVEGRFWFGNRTKRQQMTGWYAGVYAGGGYYDLELNRKGYQGEFFIASGISGGFAHTINKKGTLRMEYGIGVGYMSTNYRRYEAKFSSLDNSWHLYKQETGKFSWIGPTRAKVSLVWMLDTDFFRKKGGRK